MVNKDEGNITAEGYRFYEELRTKSLKGMPVPHVTILLDASASLCQKRVATRARSCENMIPVDYLTKLEVQYKAFLDEMQALGSAVLTVDWTMFGTTAVVKTAIDAAPCQDWTEAQLAEAQEFIDMPSAEALAIPFYLAEADITDHVTSIYDGSKEAEMLKDQNAERVVNVDRTTSISAL